jgi:type VI secretion system protein ImpE
LKSPTQFVFDKSLADSIADVQNAVRKEPTLSAHRTYLFQLLCVASSWDKALAQLQAAAQFDPAAIPMAQLYREAIRCEMIRRDVFNGTRRPNFLGNPESWTGFLCEALPLVAAGKFEEAAELRAQALDTAPASAGTVNGEAFEWIADADSRIGPIFEAIVNGQYYWIPFDHVASIKIEVPADLRDLVWATGSIKVHNGGEVLALIPARYPNSETRSDAASLARVTEWSEAAADTWLGLGQRMLATDNGDYSLLDVRAIEFKSVAK